MQFILPFDHKVQLTQDTYTFYFKRTYQFDFLPGQYTKIFLDLNFIDKKGDNRFFTIASSPLDKKFLMITTKTVSHSSFKNGLLQLTPGQTARFEEPQGGFTLRSKEPQYVMLAGGIGITSFHSILCYAAVKNLNTRFTLFVSFSTIEEMVFYEDLKKISLKHPSITVIYTITHPEKTQLWEGETGRISEKMIKKYVTDVLTSRFMISGPPEMIVKLEELLNGIGVANEKIQLDSFTGY